MEICVLGSGSSGNCTFVSFGDTKVLIDAGLNYSETCARLAVLGVTLDSISGILFTHNHADHCQSAGPLWRRHATPLFANEGTAISIDKKFEKNTVFKWNIFDTCSPFSVGHLQVEAFSVQHDAADTVGFVLSTDCFRVGIATDLGMVTPMVECKLSDCDVLILETNHDPEMLLQSKRPKNNIARILGPHGHLSNENAADMLTKLLCPRLRMIFLAHRSSDCNTPFLAERALSDVIKRAGRTDIRLLHTYSDSLSERIQIAT
jgi:phosphoribosyl 1,2-cyclic phosphodiesterase